jgi:hypothetical protein|tara:strand:+ start:142 stop:492 length:351 start_codon:yes stop_codon:yes gene_type:complete
MYKKIEKQILGFSEAMTDRAEIVHGTLYVKLKDDKDCDFFHKELRTFYRENINPDGGVNMWFVGDEFVFDFVSQDDESPTFEEKLTDDITDGAMNEPLGSKIDTLLELENEMSRGK